ncbi:MAG: hypothetical protein RBU30_04790 [Polyangia bacterium]|jgi:hypothetical protein|nr:hypothetical protein [Polyangia bacterium]
MLSKMHMILGASLGLLLLLGLASEAQARRRSGRCLKRDRLLPLKYLQGGQVFIPAALSCGGEAPIVILLHGNNQSNEKNPSLGGGRNLETLVGKYVAGRMIWPVVLAEPTHHGACSSEARSSGLPPVFGPPFSFHVYRKKLEELLRKNGIKVKSISLLAHSGSGCCQNAGIYAAAAVFPRIFVFGTSDTCYGSPFYADFIIKRFSGTRTRVLNTCRGVSAYPAYREYEKRLVTSRPVSFKPCDGRYYSSCKRHPKQFFFAYVTKPTTVTSHNQVFTEFVKSVLFKFFRRKR